MPYPQIHRLVVAGGDRVGKTAIIEQLIFGNHVIGQGGVPTLGDIYDIVLETEKGTHERLQIFDTPGSVFAYDDLSEQDHYLLIADGFVLVYEITSKSSFDLVTRIRQKIATKNKEVPVIMIGNKSDCNAIREVKQDTVNSWARSYGIRPYEVTVMNRDSLREPFSYIAWRMANPNRAFSALPLLTTTATSSVHTLLDHPVFHEDGPLSKMDESQHGATLTGSQDEHDGGYPQDALYPGKRGGAAALFLGDCMSTRNKQEHSRPKPLAK